MIRKAIRRLGKAVLDFGTEGLSRSRARQIQTCTIGTIAIIGVGPFFALHSMLNGIPFWSRQVFLNWGLNPMILAPFIVLLLLGFRDAARIAYVLGVNASVFLYTWMSGVDGGLYLYTYALGLVPFFVFGLNEWKRLCFFVVLAAAAVIFESVYFRMPLPGFEMGPVMLRQLWTMNFVTSFLITIFVFATVVSMVRNGEQRMERFSGAVSEYLDSDLVERLRAAEDVMPRVCPITVFFADLIGSTRISFAMSRESFGRMINDYMHEMQMIIKSRGGYIEDISGDGIFGYLGNFDTRGPEQDAIDVVTMCVEMRQRLASLNLRFREMYGLDRDLNVRIGISTGEATVGRSSGVRALYTANGDVVNLGAKLERKVDDISADGGILISEATADYVAGTVDLVRHEIEVEGSRIVAFEVR